MDNDKIQQVITRVEQELCLKFSEDELTDEDFYIFTQNKEYFCRSVQGAVILMSMFLKHTFEALEDEKEA